METLTVNLTGKARRVFGVDGRAYLVAPVVLLVPGVLNGSQGPLYYPPEECSKSPERWNGIPLTKDHPLVNGSPVSALEEGVLDKVGLGFLTNVGFFRSKLRGEAWFDEEAVKAKSPRVHEALIKGEKIEVSTGLYTTNDPSTTGVYNGKSYTATARDYRPDHLAVLVDKVGACSVVDGCGVLVTHSEGTPDTLQADFDAALFGTVLDNALVDQELTLNPYPNEHAARVRDPKQFKKDSFRRKEITDGVSVIFAKMSGDGPMVIQAYRFDARKFTAQEAREWLKKHKIDAKLEPATGTQNKSQDTQQGDEKMTRQENVAWLTANCDCWKDSASKPDLDKLSDSQVQKLRTNAEKTLKALEVEEAARKGFTDPGGSTHVYNAEKKTWESKAKEPTPTPATPPAPAPVANSQPQLTAEQEEDLAFARAEKKRRKDEIIARLTANISDSGQKAARAQSLQTKSLKDLAEILDLMPPAPAPTGSQGERIDSLPSWVGASVGVPPTHNSQSSQDDEVLMPPTVNFNEDPITKRLAGANN
jgi:hypothetical protein